MLEFVDGLPIWIKVIIGLNFLISAVMWLGEPVVITTDALEASALSFGPLIVVGNELYEPLDDFTTYVLTHEYGHYLQTMILTPILMIPSYLTSTAYSFLTAGNYFENNFFEQQAIEYGHHNVFVPKLILHF